MTFEKGIYILYMQITRIGIWKVLALPSFGDPFLRWLAERELDLSSRPLRRAMPDPNSATSLVDSSQRLSPGGLFTAAKSRRTLHGG
ncbi:hypothetical protein CpipJ_CPIJ008488 [Culex quinquefasciatus]|uniref:Uncharacterized protein n=1 Tax=Culex quinquefasciatus TaxID=7176 RepID=B0WN03_CULQU|nr:hypothetical protein CpipJ_CPIJ008488 [Culex quinquefasciatus]|eukprot:XP_001850087.1 hypothetical protein CpipJ_CPIJ008488 [Culex quinquefasciatus]